MKSGGSDAMSGTGVAVLAFLRLPRSHRLDSPARKVAAALDGCY